MNSAKTQQAICTSGELPELGKFGFAIEYRGAPHAAILIRFHGAVYAYLNRCVHMPMCLDCDGERSVFDDSGRYLRCTMHTIHYDPTTGECLSDICAGRRLTPLRVEEIDSVVYLADKRAVLN